MLLDFDDPQTVIPASVDICIVGAGAAGILLATELARAGRTVALLEGGGLQQQPRSQAIYQSHLDGQPHRGIHQGRFRTYGGSTTQWGGQILELDEADFLPRPHVPSSGWPFPKSELTPYYERALRFEGLRRVERNDTRVWQGLGLTPPDIGPSFTQAFSRWCPERNFAALHSRELATLPRLQVFTHASVTALQLNDARTALTAVQVRGFSGRSATLAADHFILCLGGIESTRLLLQPLSEGIAPWQHNGLLGRHFQDHIALNGISLRTVHLAEPRRHFGFLELRGFRYHNKLKLHPDQQRALQTLNVAATIGPNLQDNPAFDRAQVLLRQVLREGRRPTLAECAATALQLPRIATNLVSHRLHGDAPAWRRLMLTLHCEQSPQSESRIRLAGDRDALGLLRTRLDWRISDLELHSLRACVRAAQQAFAQSGLARIEPPAGFFTDDTLVRSLCVDSNHHMGGVRMALSPSEGIVDPNLRLHGIANAFVCSSAVFPSSGFSNPTHTLLALGMRLSDHLLHRPAQPIAVITEPMRTIALPGSSRPVPQLGFGCSGLLGPGLDNARSLRLLDAAYDAGIRHFDVARLYGQGHTESLLGEFLRSHRDATVTTKYGVLPPNPIQRTWEGAARRFPLLPHLHRKDKGLFTAKEATQSLHTSLRALGRDHVELFLLHEPDVDDLCHDDLLDFLHRQREQGTIGGFGIGGEFHRIPALLRERPAYAQVLQFEHSILGPHLDLPNTRRIHYRTFARPSAALWKHLNASQGLAARWAQELEVELEESSILASLFLRAVIDLYPDTLLLFSSSTEEHIFTNVDIAQSPRWAGPASRLRARLSTGDFGVGEALYGTQDER